MLKEGDKAPTFTLLDQDGEPFELSESLEQKARHLILLLPGVGNAGVSPLTS
jgi:peroxiredoxin